jgi:hypothetical protein
MQLLGPSSRDSSHFVPMPLTGQALRFALDDKERSAIAEPHMAGQCKRNEADVVHWSRYPECFTDS